MLEHEINCGLGFHVRGERGSDGSYGGHLLFEGLVGVRNLILNSKTKEEPNVARRVWDVRLSLSLDLDLWLDLRSEYCVFLVLSDWG